MLHFAVASLERSEDGRLSGDVHGGDVSCLHLHLGVVGRVEVARLHERRLTAVEIHVHKVFVKPVEVVAGVEVEDDVQFLLVSHHQRLVGDEGVAHAVSGDQRRPAAGRRLSVPVTGAGASVTAGHQLLSLRARLQPELLHTGVGWELLPVNVGAALVQKTQRLDTVAAELAGRADGEGGEHDVLLDGDGHGGRLAPVEVELIDALHHADDSAHRQHCAVEDGAQRAARVIHDAGRCFDDRLTQLSVKPRNVDCALLCR